MDSVPGRALLAVILAVPWTTAVGEDPVDRIAPLVRVVDLDVGEQREVTLSDGSRARVRLLDLRETIDPMRQAVRRATVTVEVDGERVELVSATYHRPRTVGRVRIDSPVTRGYTEKSRSNVWALEKAARLRLWPKASPLVRPGTFMYPAKQRWFASDTQMANVPTFVDAGEEPGSKSIYYHYGLDIGGPEGLVDIVAATDGLVVSAGTERISGHESTPVSPRYDVVYLLDGRGWYYRYSHLQTIDPSVRPGAIVRMGQKVGVLGKEGGSGGWSHLHFDISSRQPSGEWGIEEGYAMLWDAYVRERRPRIIAVARPHHVALTGDRVTLDGSRSWAANGQPIRLEWRLHDGTTSSEPSVARVYDAPGQYSEILRAVDSEGHVAYDFAVVQVFDRDAPRRLTTIHAASWPTFDIRPGDEVTFKVRSFGSRTGEVWDFGDGSPEVAVRSDGNAQKLAPDGYAVTRHRFSTPGDHVVRVSHVDENGLTATAHLHVPVRGETSARLVFDRVVLPPLVIEGRPARAHTQGLHVGEHGLFVTARQDDVTPRRPLLLWARLDAEREVASREWARVLDISPRSVPAAWTGVLDHPGGLDSDGERLWIPVSHSRRKGKTLILAYSIRGLVEDASTVPVVRFAVDDHIGAVAVSRARGELYGASWDTERVHVWSLEGERKAVVPRSRFVHGRPDWAHAVQDWKVHGELLIAGGLDRSPSRTAPRALLQAISLEGRELIWELRLAPSATGVEMTREGLAIDGEHVWFLPEDLGAMNQLYRARLAELRRGLASD